MSRFHWIAVAAAGFLLLPAASRGEDFRAKAVESIEKHTGWKTDHSGDPKESASPFRKALKLKLDDRIARGQKTPKVTSEVPTLTAKADDEGWGPGDCAERKRCPTKGYVVRYRTVTTLEYNGPDEIHDGKDGKRPEWPPLQVAKKVWNPATNGWDTVEVEDHTREYQDLIAKQFAAQNPPQVAWKVDPKDPNDPGKFEFGQEPQIEDVTEEITFTFPSGNQAQGEAFFRQLSAALAAGAGPEAAILMGFTYQGPNIDYTIGSSKRACFFGCVTLWDIRAGFALDFGVGLRVPAHSKLTGVEQMVAGQAYAFTSEIDTSGANGDWAPPQFTAAGVNPYSNRGQPLGQGNGEGNEFVMYFDFFAGAKVTILEKNVCPYCQYVEVTADYSTSFGTPFGPGTRFPLPQVEIPIKDFDYGIVSLIVGLYVRPDVTSSNIGALASTGIEVPHSAPGEKSTFSVAACIPNEAPRPHYQTVSLDEYRYHFTDFRLVLGAWLDFSVAGYGAWSPKFDFLTLDLSNALGTLGIYLPDHRNCDLTFSCTPAPAVQQAAWTSEVIDESPPATELVLGGTQGRSGWWTSDVTGTMAAKDNPTGCGAGVDSTWWGLSSPPATLGTSFLLSDERIMTTYWRSIDRDGNVEAVKELQVKIDKTPPTIEGAPTTAPNGNGWYNHDVVVHYVASDATSGIASLTPDTTLSLEAARQELTGTAEDQAGLSSTYTVGNLNIDKTRPAIAIAAPTAAAKYRNVDTFNLTWNAADGLSGIASEGGTLDGAPATNGQLVELIYLGGGTHEVRAFATDKADNVNQATVTFVVDVDIDGLLAAVDTVCGLEWVNKLGTCSSLRAKVIEAKASLAAGLNTDARGQLGAFLNELDAQQDKSLLDRGYRLLRADAQYVLVRYGLVPAV